MHPTAMQRTRYTRQLQTARNGNPIIILEIPKDDSVSKYRKKLGVQNACKKK
ncbi:MAG: hypothetical protein LBH25_01535 [Fibromonadaceae bacterium]|jgi:hypothetical protein|nr:hypothetical protein [Fibromonadaceae bacterium]